MFRVFEVIWVIGWFYSMFHLYGPVVWHRRTSVAAAMSWTPIWALIVFFLWWGMLPWYLFNKEETDG